MSLEALAAMTLRPRRLLGAACVLSPGRRPWEAIYLGHIGARIWSGSLHSICVAEKTEGPR